LSIFAGAFLPPLGDYQLVNGITRWRWNGITRWRWYIEQDARVMKHHRWNIPVNEEIQESKRRVPRPEAGLAFARPY
jgi:hypothetical protein